MSTRESLKARTAHVASLHTDRLAGETAKQATVRVWREWKSMGCECGNGGTGEFPWLGMHADHVDPSTKIDKPSRIAKSGNMNALVAELIKCIVRCAYCHECKTWLAGDHLR